MSHFYFVFGKGGRGYATHHITPVNNVAFVLCIWKGEHSLKHKIIPVDNIVFVLYIWKRGYSLEHRITPIKNIAFVLCIWKFKGAGGIDPNAFIPHFD